MKLNFGRIMRSLAQRHAGREALVNIERGRRYTYDEYHRLTNRIAHAMSGELGIGKGDRFLVILDNDNGALLQFPTFLKQAGTAVLANRRDSFDEHRWQVEFCKPKVAFLERDLLPSYYEMLRSHNCEIVVMDPPASALPGTRYFWDLVERALDDDPEVEIDDRQDLVLLRFTGGTTARGKCAAYTADNLLAGIDATRADRELAFDSSARVLHVSPLSHATLLAFFPTFFSGGTNLTLNALDLQAWRTIVSQERVTHSFLVPTILYRLLQLQLADPIDLSSLTTLIYGGAPMSPSKLADLVECFGPVFAQLYASTEVPTLVSVLDKSEHRNDDTGRRRLSSAGRVMPGVEVVILDEAGRPVAPGVTGEIWIRARAVVSGYLGNEDASRSEFMDGGWKSGDVGYLDADGFLYIVDRMKDMVVTGGFNVYASEVESALMSHPAVMLAAVVGIPHEDWGESVHSEVVVKPDARVSAEELIAHAKSRIASYKAPKSIDFVNDLPVSVVGKVLRRQVREKYWRGQARNVG